MRRHGGTRGDGSDWAFHASNAAVFEALARGEHEQSLREYFGASALSELRALAVAAKRARTGTGRRAGRLPRVLIVPGMMGSRLCEGAPGRDARGPARRALWVDPLRIAAGHLERLSLPGSHPIRAVGALLPGYAKLKLSLAIQGFDARFFAYDWRFGIDRLGKALAARIAAAGRPVALVAHSMGGLVARVAMARVPERLVRRLIMLGTPNGGALAPVLALRGTYPFVQRLSRLDLAHTPEFLASRVFRTFPGLYQMLPAGGPGGGLDLLDPGSWPASGPQPDPELLARVVAARAAMAPADARMAHIVGFNQPTVVGVERCAAGFAYASDLNGDGTVPVNLARVRALETYFADERHGDLPTNARIIEAIAALLRKEACRLTGRFVPSRAPPLRFDDAALRAAELGKIDWRGLGSAEREAVLGDLDRGPSPNPELSAQSLA